MDREAWLHWRKSGIGSSDAAALHGVSPYKTEYQLWEEKTADGVSDLSVNFAMQKGNDLEPKIRAELNKSLESVLGFANEFQPKNFVMPVCEFMRASLDGFAVVQSKRVGAEIKFQGEENHWLVSDDRLPVRGGSVQEHYWIQCQHQILVADLDHVLFVSSPDGEHLNMRHIERDDEFLKEHLKVCTEFWRRVQERQAPPLSDRDFETLETAEAKALAKSYKLLSSEIERLEKYRDEAKQDLLKLVSHPRTRVGDVRIVKVRRAGSIDYNRIPELQNVDLEKFRRRPTEFYKLDLPRTGKK